MRARSDGTRTQWVRNDIGCVRGMRVLMSRVAERWISPLVLLCCSYLPLLLFNVQNDKCCSSVVHVQITVVCSSVVHIQITVVCSIKCCSMFKSLWFVSTVEFQVLFMFNSSVASAEKFGLHRASPACGAWVERQPRRRSG